VGDKSDSVYYTIKRMTHKALQDFGLFLLFVRKMQAERDIQFLLNKYHSPMRDSIFGGASRNSISVADLSTSSKN
jgi:hypothetical protein